MKEHEFTLVISGDLDDEATLDALFEAGCDDATFGMVDGAGYGDFIREAPSFGEAIRTAIENVESIGGLKVVRVEPDDLVTMAEIAERLERSRESVRLLIAGRRGPGGFPSPASHLRARSRWWRWSEVAAWADANALPVDRESASLIAAINAILTLRENTARLPVRQRELIWSLA